MGEVPLYTPYAQPSHEESAFITGRDQHAHCVFPYVKAVQDQDLTPPLWFDLVCTARIIL